MSNSVEQGAGAGATGPSVLIVDDHPLFRMGLSMALKAEGFSVVGEAENGRQAVERCPEAMETAGIVILHESCILKKAAKEDAHFSRYYDAIYILFHTGLRISEFCGLTVSEIEFDEMRIKVDHQLQRTSQMKYVIEEPKTESGTRYVPMTEEVAECFRRIIANREAPKVEPMVDGYIRFLCLDKNDMPKVALHWEKYLEHIVEKYNKIYRIQMPKVTPHVCRHTFCSNMAKSGMNPKTLQYIMGHSDISVTLNVYTHVNFDDAKAEVLRVANG